MEKHPIYEYLKPYSKKLQENNFTPISQDLSQGLQSWAGGIYKGIRDKILSKGIDVLEKVAKLPPKLVQLAARNPKLTPFVIYKLWKSGRVKNLDDLLSVSKETVAAMNNKTPNVPPSPTDFENYINSEYKKLTPQEKNTLDGILLQTNAAGIPVNTFNPLKKKKNNQNINRQRNKNKLPGLSQEKSDIARILGLN